MKVYVVVHKYLFDSGAGSLEVKGAFTNKANAIEKAQLIKSEALIHWDEYFDTNYEIMETENYIEIWECEEYNSNHEIITITEVEVVE